MGFFGTILGVIGFGFGFPFGLFMGFYLFIYSESNDVEDPVIKELSEVDGDELEDLMPEIPLWVKSPDYDRVDWLNQLLSGMWPFLDKAICSIIRSTAEPMFAEYIGKFKIETIEFDTLTLGNLPLVIQGLKVIETNEKELVMEPAVRWAGNPNITVAVTIASVRVTIQLVDLQVFAAPRVTLKPLVPTIPCFANIVVSLMEKPYVDFGMNVLGGDVMSIPGLYRYVQERIKKEVAVLYLWPKSLQIPVLDASMRVNHRVAVKKPVGILHVKVVHATNLLKMDLLGLSDPYVKLNLSGDNLPAKKTTVKKKTLNPEWNEEFKLSVKDPQSQLLNINMYDWDKVGAHDRLGSQIFPLKHLLPNEPKEATLDLLKDTTINDPHKKKPRGQIVLELKYAPFREDHETSIRGPLNNGISRKFSVMNRSSSSEAPKGAGLLLVTIQGAQDVEGSRHNNPYVLIVFRGETKRSKMMRKTRNPTWNEEFQFLLEEPPLQEKLHINVMSKRTGISFNSKESLGHVDINLDDVVYNGRINHKYHLIDSKNGMIHVELKWRTV